MMINFNWGTKIFLLYTGFAIMLFFMVYKATTKEFYLVADNYYQEELAFEDRLVQMRNSQGLAEQLQIENDLERSTINLKFPLEGTKGTIKMYRPSDARLDNAVDIAVDENNAQQLDVSEMLTGMWKMQVSWEVNGVKYFDEEILILR